MFNLLRRTKNKKLQHQEDTVDLSSEEVAQNTVQGLNENLEAKNLPKLHEKNAKTKLNRIGNFMHIGMNRNVMAKEKAADEREVKFAKIYFEENDGKGNKNETYCSTGEKRTVDISDVFCANDGGTSNVVSVVSGGSGSGSGASGAEQTNDSTNTSNQERHILAKRKYPKRKPLSFRRVDLDGVNSIIEAIALGSEDDEQDNDKDSENGGNENGTVKDHNNEKHDVNDKERTTDGDHHQVNGPDSERHSSNYLNLLSPNERVEWLGRNLSSTHSSEAIKSDKLQSNVGNKINSSIAFSSNELNATNLSGAAASESAVAAAKAKAAAVLSAGNVRNSIDQNEPTTTGNENAVNGHKGVVSSEVVVPIKNSKQIKQARRRSFFQRKTSEPTVDVDVESGAADSQVKSEKSQKPIDTVKSENSVNSVKNETKKSDSPLKKSKKFFANLFMARGRHHHHQHPNQNQNQRNRNQVPSSNHQKEPCKSSSSKSNNNQNAAVTADHSNCQNVVICNKDDSTISNEIRNAEKFIEDDQRNNSSTMLRQHLETTNSPIRQCDPAAASVQVTYSNNSPKNAIRRVVSFGEGKPQHRSNSADLPRERRENETNKLNVSESEQQQQQHKRSVSEEPHGDRERRWPPGVDDNARARASPSVKERQTPEQSASTPHDVQSFTRARDIEQNGNNAENSVDRLVADENNIVHYNSESDERDEADWRELTAFMPRDQLTNSSQKSQQQQEQQEEQHQQQQQQDANVEKQEICIDAISMGQTYAKNETHADSARANQSCGLQRESVLSGGTDDTSFSPRPAVTVPKITIEDFSVGKSVHTNNESPNDNDVFYDFESECTRSIPLNSKHLLNDVNNNNNNNNSNSNGIDNDDEEEDFDSDIDDEIFHEQVVTSQPASFTTYRHNSPLRRSPSKLADVIELEEDDEEDDEAIDVDADGFHVQSNCRPTSLSTSPERYRLKSSDSNLSNSYPDSGISGSGSSDSQASASPPECNDTTTTNNNNNNNKNVSKSASRSSLPTQQQPNRRQRSPFVRDSTSNECDDTILQCDDIDCLASTLASECSSETTVGSAGDRLVCIESISLPDVVESTTSSPCNGNGNGQSNSTTAASPASSGGTGGEQIININGATGNSMGNVHFIPIHVESPEQRCRGGGLRANSPNQQKQRSVDDSCIGNGMKSTRFTHLNGGFDLSDKPTIEIIEDDEPTKLSSEKMRFESDEQVSRLNTQVDDAQKFVQNLQTKINELQTKIGNLEQELSTKTWNVERLQSELNASQREDEFVRKKLRLLQEEETALRHKYSENEDEYRRQYAELEKQYKELQENYKSTQQLAQTLHIQLASAKSEAEQWRQEVDTIRCDLEDQIRILKSALENSEAERKICEDRWQKEYEILRTQHMDREETLMTDCEWQLRQMQKQWKDKLDKSENERRDAIEAVELIGLELETRKREVEDLRHYETEVKSLRGVVTEQHNSISILMNQIENLKTELQIANVKLDEQIEAVAKIKFQCENAICDKERQMVYRIDEVRNEAACFWENKLYTEMTRLKNELESVFVDERREALDKLQAEHIEELRALTTRYTANEDELRLELAELQERLDLKSQEYLELRDKSDNALLQTRMHLDRADREYQNAMCREEDKREALEEKLKQQFEAEKQEMEAKFRERLNQVKEEFAAELQNSKQEMTQKHQKELEQLKAKLKAEKDEALQELADRHRQKLTAAEDRMKNCFRNFSAERVKLKQQLLSLMESPKKRELELRHQNDLKELKASYDEDKAILDKRDMSNASEIDQLHRRCRCLTNLFEEMRMRYERRDPRPEDLREIDELRTRCDSQERDLFELTAQLRELQMQQNDSKPNSPTKKGGKSIQKPPPKTIPTSCDVIYEENEERDVTPPPPSTPLNDDIDNDDGEE